MCLPQPANSLKQQLRGTGYLIWVYGSLTTGARRCVNSNYGITTTTWKEGLPQEEHQLGHCSGPV